MLLHCSRSLGDNVIVTCNASRDDHLQLSYMPSSSGNPLLCSSSTVGPCQVVGSECNCCVQATPQCSAVASISYSQFVIYVRDVSFITTWMCGTLTEGDTARLTLQLFGTYTTRLYHTYFNLSMVVHSCEL
jgi:hypothetical protein